MEGGPPDNWGTLIILPFLQLTEVAAELTITVVHKKNSIMNEPLPKVDQMDENAKILRSMIEQENNLQNYRVTWLMTIQGLLFAALGFAWDKNDTRELIGLFCVLGLLVSLISWSALQLSGKAYHELVNWWNQHKPQNYNGPPIMGDTGRPNWLLWLLRPWRALPWIFALSWVTVFILNLQR